MEYYKRGGAGRIIARAINGFRSAEDSWRSSNGSDSGGLREIEIIIIKKKMQNYDNEYIWISSQDRRQQMARRSA